MVVPCHNSFEGPSRTPERGNIGVVYPAAGPGGFKCPNATDNQRAPNGNLYQRQLPEWKRTILKALSRRRGLSAPLLHRFESRRGHSNPWAQLQPVHLPGVPRNVPVVRNHCFWPSVPLFVLVCSLTW